MTQIAPPRFAGVSTIGRGGRVAGPALLAVSLLLTALHLLALHQGPGWASPLLIGDRLFDLAFASTLLLYALALGRRLGRPLLALSGDPLVEGLAALGIGIGAISLSLLIAGLLRLYYAPAMLGAFVALTVWLRRELRATLAELARAIGTLRAARAWATAPLGHRLLALILLATLGLVLVRAMAPIAADANAPEWDSTVYHLAGPKIYMAEHRLVPRPDILLANAPAGGDILFIPGLYAGSDGSAKMLDLDLGLLIAVATYALGRRHFGPQAGELGALLFLTTDWIPQLMPTPGPDWAAALLVVLGSSDLLAWATARTENRLLARAGLLLGIGISCKLTNLPVAPGAGLAVAAVCLWPGQGTIATRTRALLRGGLLLGAALALPLLPWLAKSHYYFGNPFYPTAVEATGHAEQGIGIAVQVSSNHPSIVERAWFVLSNLCSTSWYYITPLALLLLAMPWILRGAAARTALMLIVASAVFWLLFVPLFLPPRYWLGIAAVADALVAATLCTMLARLAAGDGRRTVRPIRLEAVLRLLIWSRLSGARWLALLLTLDSGLWLALYATGQGGSAAFPLIVVLGYLAVLWLLRRNQPAGASAIPQPVLAFLCMAALLSLGLQIRLLDVRGTADVARGALSRSDFVAMHAWAYPPEQWANEHLPGDAKIVLIHVTPGYWLDRGYLTDWYGSRFAAVEGDPVQRRTEAVAWCTAGIRYAIFNRGPEEDWDPRFVYPLSHFAWTRQAGLAPRTLWSSGGVDVLAISPCNVR